MIRNGSANKLIQIKLPSDNAAFPPLSIHGFYAAEFSKLLALATTQCIGSFK
jgi:hypothetical protein